VSGSDNPSGQTPAPEGLEILRLDAKIAHLVPAGGLDGDRLHSLLHQGVASLIADGVTGLVVDMRAFSLLDSTGLGALVSCRAEIAGMDGARLVLTGVSASLRHTLSRAMLLQVLPVYETVERAFAALRS
jgi:anti-anti-sigma factor